MNRRKVLLAIVLLVLTQFAFGASNPEYVGTPYYDISTQKPRLLKENTTRSGQQISKSNEVDFFEIVNNAPESKNPFPIADVELEFLCPQAESGENYYGWRVNIWKHYKDSSKADELFKNYDAVSNEKCSEKFSMILNENDDYENEVASYYVGVQSACVSFPNTMNNLDYYFSKDTNDKKNQLCDSSDYKLKVGLIPKEIIADTNTLTEIQLKTATALGAIKTGQIKLATDNNIYSVETYSTTDTAGTNEVPLLFSCTQAATRYTNDWKLTVYDEKNTVAAGYPRYINGSDCGSTLVDDKGGFKFTLPKDSPRYFVSIQSACDLQSKKTCVVETSQYNIARDVTKIYAGSLSATKSITAKSANFKLTRCGLNSNSIISVKVEDENLIEMFKSKTIPIKIQIGTMACQILTPQSFDPAKEIMLGSITGNAEIIDASLIAKDSATVTLGECISSNKTDVASKITLTGIKLDLENLNPSQTTNAATTAATSSNNSVVIPVKVDIGDFHCEGKDAFYIETDKPKVGNTTYSNNLQTDFTDYTADVKNIDPSVEGSIKDKTAVNLYYVDSSINSDTVLNFSCDASITRFNNDWKLLVYNNDKTLNGTPYVINSSDCASGKDGDNGAYKITIPKDKGSVRYFVAVKSSCDVDDNACKVNESPYILSREIPTIVAPATGSFDSAWLTTKKNLGASQTGQINSLTDTQIYQVDTGTTDANLTFGCLNSVRYQNDWKMMIYDSTKTLKSTTVINGSACGIGRVGDTGTYPLLLTKDSPTYYVVVKSACESGDTNCVIDKSQYQLNRVTPAQAAAIEAAKPCFGAGCATTTPVVKPFFK